MDGDLKCCLRDCEERGQPEEGYTMYVCPTHLRLLEDAMQRAALMQHAHEARN